MKVLKLTILFIIFFSASALAQKILPVQFRVEKQSMSTPMSLVEDIFFDNSFYTKPVNVNFDGDVLAMYFDNGATFTKKQVTKVDSYSDYEGEELIMETTCYVDNANVSDTLLFVVDFEVGYMQMILPAKNSKGVAIGYTSYRKFVNEDELASR